LRISAESETELIRRAKRGDREAFGTLVLRHGPMVRRLTRAVLGHGPDADDAAQDAFFSAWSKLDRFADGQPLGPWLARIALNAARDLRRRRVVRRAEPIETVQVIAPDAPDAQTDRALLRGRLEGALAELPERQRVALLLHEVEGYAHAEIGALLGVPEGTARSEVFHARRKLRAALGVQEGTP